MGGLLVAFLILVILILAVVVSCIKIDHRRMRILWSVWADILQHGR